MRVTKAILYSSAATLTLLGMFQAIGEITKTASVPSDKYEVFDVPSEGEELKLEILPDKKEDNTWKYKIDDTQITPETDDGLWQRNTAGNYEHLYRALVLRADKERVTITGKLSPLTEGDGGAGEGGGGKTDFMVRVPDIDIDIDSDNDDGFNPPKQDIVEDHLEDNANELGKIIGVNDGDTDNDGIPGYADWDSNDHFIPVVITLSSNVVLNEAEIKIDYKEVMPNQVSLDPATGTWNIAGDGFIRLWTKNGDEVRNSADLGAGGNFVKSGTYTPAQLGFADTDIGRKRTFYLEGVKPCSKEAISVTLTTGGKNVVDAVVVTVITANITIYNGLDGVSGGDQVADLEEMSLGAVTVANLNDTGGDGTPDNRDTDVSVTGDTPPGRQEHDLMKLVLEEPQPTGVVKNVRIRIISGDVKIYKQGPVGKEQSKVNGLAELTQNPALFTDSNGDGVKDSVCWIEALNHSSIRGIELTYEWQVKEGTPWIKGDTVKATAIWIQKTARSPWCVRSNEEGFPNNPEPGLENDLSQLNSLSVNAAISYDQAKDGSRYGFGTFRKGTISSDQSIGGRILFEWQILPSEAESLGVSVDVTRQRKGGVFFMSPNSEIQGAPESITVSDFPWEQATVRDNEMPNDDTVEEDEDNSPKDGYIYSYDAPSTSIQVLGLDTFHFIRLTFKEWVRVQINSQGFTHELLPGSEPEQNLGQVQGTRASDKLDWHLSLYSRRGADGKLEEDNTPASVSFPQMLVENANGSCVVELLPDAVTSGYQGEFSLNQKEWKLTEKPSNAVTSDQKAGPTPAGTTWLLTVGNKLKLTVTQGAIPFEDWDSIIFDVFKTQAEGGKINEISTGTMDVTGEL